jgi:hypothetical protein
MRGSRPGPSTRPGSVTRLLIGRRLMDAGMIVTVTAAATATTTAIGIAGSSLT